MGRCKMTIRGYATKLFLGKGWSYLVIYIIVEPI
jgi:hypothetical protein